jgi:hypothetical protein
MELSLESNRYSIQIGKLKTMIKENKLKEMYERALHAFKYWSFPFTCSYKERFNINEDTQNIKDFSKELDKIATCIQEDKYGLDPSKDNYINKLRFDEKFPFYEWSYKEFKYELESLLNRNTLNATLFADVKSTNKNAIKFSSIYILIEAQSSSEKNRSLNKVLGNFQIHLKYAGDAHYLYDNIPYVIKTDYLLNDDIQPSYHYGCLIDCDGNESYHKLNKINKPLLSPYTLWELRLVFRENVHEHSYHAVLNELEDVLGGDLSDITVKLCGRGTFVKIDKRKNK